MGRVWVDEDEYEPRVPISNWRAFAVITLMIIIILVFTACSDGPSSVALPQAPAPQSLDMEQDRIADPQRDLEVELCDMVISGETSHLVPTDWDDWCVGVNAAAVQFATGSEAELTGVCDYFWTADDEDLVGYAVEEGGTDSWGIGFVDFMWWYC